MSWTIHHGDCLDVMPSMDAASVDAVICDPPYMVGSISVGNSSAKSGTWADMENSAYWFSAWIRESKRLLRSTGYLLCFGNWRSIPTLIRALSLCELQSQSCMIWDKQWIGPAYKNALRPRYEIVMFAAMPDAQIDDRRQPDIYSCKWMAGNMKTTKHPAEKPVDLMRHLCRLVTPPGGLILDPFCGSGSTGEAAVLDGFQFIGIEREAEYVGIAKDRIAAATPKGTLF